MWCFLDGTSQCRAPSVDSLNLQWPPHPATYILQIRGGGCSGAAASPCGEGWDPRMPAEWDLARQLQAGPPPHQVEAAVGCVGGGQRSRPDCLGWGGPGGRRDPALRSLQNARRKLDTSGLGRGSFLPPGTLINLSPRAPARCIPSPCPGESQPLPLERAWGAFFRPGLPGPYPGADSDWDSGNGFGKSSSSPCRGQGVGGKREDDWACPLAPAVPPPTPAPLHSGRCECQYQAPRGRGQSAEPHPGPCRWETGLGRAMGSWAPQCAQLPPRGGVSGTTERRGLPRPSQP